MWNLIETIISDSSDGWSEKIIINGKECMKYTICGGVLNVDFKAIRAGTRPYRANLYDTGIIDIWMDAQYRDPEGKYLTVDEMPNIDVDTGINDDWNSCPPTYTYAIGLVLM